VLADFTPRSEVLKVAPDLGWSTKPFAAERSTAKAHA